VVVFSGEMTPESQLKRMVKQAAGLDRPTPAYIDAIGHWMSDRLWLFDQVGSATIERLLAVFLYANRRHGATHFVIDSLMMTDVPEDGPGSMSAQKMAVQRMANFARQHKVHLHLVAHPRKAENESKAPGKLDVAGSSKITDGADNVFSVWSARRDEMDEPSDQPDALLELHKQRNGETQHRKQFCWFVKGAQQFATSPHRKPVSYVPFQGEPNYEEVTHAG
jgi:twinkle protein